MLFLENLQVVISIDSLADDDAHRARSVARTAHRAPSIARPTRNLARLPIASPIASAIAHPIHCSSRSAHRSPSYVFWYLASVSPLLGIAKYRYMTFMSLATSLRPQSLNQHSVQVIISAAAHSRPLSLRQSASC